MLPGMQVSQNVYAETLLRAIGRVDGRAATAADGKDAVLAVLQAWGVPAGSLVVADGSGLSRYNYVTADAMVSILRHMHDDPRHHQPWQDALAVAGARGTLQKRFVGTPLEGRVRDLERARAVWLCGRSQRRTVGVFHHRQQRDRHIRGDL